MSRLSFEEVKDGAIVVRITEKAYAIDIEFEQTVMHTSGSSNTITLNVGAPALAMDAVNLNYMNSVASNYSYQTVGFRLFFEKGYLKCLKKEVPYSLMANGTGISNYIGSSATNNTLQFTVKRKKKLYNESFYFPSIVNQQFGGCSAMGVIESKLLSLAERVGVKIPQKYVLASHHTYSNPTSSSSFCPLLDWLTFPLIREIDSVAVAMRLSNVQRKAIAPKHSPMNFKQLVEYYYGTSTSKMLDEVWNAVTIGCEYRSTVISPLAELSNVGIEDQVLRNGFGPITRRIDRTFYQHGDRHVNMMMFTVAPAIFKTMGFDYLYQSLKLLRKEEENRLKNRARLLEPPWNMNNIQPSIQLMLRYVTPKKLITKICDGAVDMESLTDAARMLTEYSEVSKIPKSLKSQYPEGLTVDFKFKTLKELHDKISTQYTIIKAEAAKKDIPVHPLYAKLDGRERNGLRLVVPRSTAPLALWGKQLHICVASYGDRAAGANTLLLGVEKEGEIKYCIEFSSMQVACLSDSEPSLASSYKEGNPPTEDTTTLFRAALPRLEERQSIVPLDVPEEEGIYQAPSIVQFRTEFNRDPSSEDKEAVQNMLVQWVHENREELNKIKELKQPTYNSGVYQYELRAVANPRNNIVVNNLA